MTLEEIGTYIPIIGVPLAGAIAWVYNEYRKDKKEKSLSDITRERTYADRLEHRLLDREADIERLSKQVMEARTLTGMSPEEVLKDFVNNDPGLSWVKKRVGPYSYTMIRVSKGYAKTFLKGPPEIYDGKTDNDMWPIEVAVMFAQNDEKVYIDQEGIHIVEKTPDGNFVGRKFPVHLEGADYVIGVGGYEPISDEA